MGWGYEMEGKSQACMEQEQEVPGFGGSGGRGTVSYWPLCTGWAQSVEADNMKQLPSGLKRQRKCQPSGAERGSAVLLRPKSQGPTGVSRVSVAGRPASGESLGERDGRGRCIGLQAKIQERGLAVRVAPRTKAGLPGIDIPRLLIDTSVALTTSLALF